MTHNQTDSPSAQAYGDPGQPKPADRSALDRNDQAERPETSTHQPPGDSRADIFVERLASLCRDFNVELAIMAVMITTDGDTKSNAQPVLYSCGHVYEVTKLTARTLRALRAKLLADTEP